MAKKGKQEQKVWPEDAKDPYQATTEDKSNDEAGIVEVFYSEITGQTIPVPNKQKKSRQKKNK